MDDLPDHGPRQVRLFPGLGLIAAERQRQVLAENWTAEHDDEHEAEELALAAVCYAAPRNAYVGSMNNRRTAIEDAWPWNAEDFKGDKMLRAWVPGPRLTILDNRPELRKARIRELVKAGALIAAEIDRLLRRPMS